MKRMAYFQGTADPKKKRKPDRLPTKRIDMDVRHPHIYTWYRNMDYTPDPDPNETGIGGGLYHGPMDRFKSVKEFLDRRRKKMKQRREKAEKRAEKIDALVRLASTISSVPKKKVKSWFRWINENIPDLNMSLREFVMYGWREPLVRLASKTLPLEVDVQGILPETYQAKVSGPRDVVITFDVETEIGRLKVKHDFGGFDDLEPYDPTSEDRDARWNAAEDTKWLQEMKEDFLENPPRFIALQWEMKADGDVLVAIPSPDPWRNTIEIEEGQSKVITKLPSEAGIYIRPFVWDSYIAKEMGYQ